MRVLDLEPELLQLFFVIVARRQRLERDSLVQRLVVGLVNFSHATSRNEAHQAVTTRELGSERDHATAPELLERCSRAPSKR
jgi:hypothetical protein